MNWILMGRSKNMYLFCFDILEKMISYYVLLYLNKFDFFILDLK